MAADPVFAATPRLATVNISAANTNRDGTGTIVDVLTGVAAGTRIESIRITARVTTTAGMIRLFLHNGTSYFLWREIPVVAITPSASARVFEAHIVLGDADPLILPSASWKLAAATHNAESFNVTAVGADL